MAGKMAFGSEVFWENLDEDINDENKIVTYKRLCLNQNSTANTSKQMLFKLINRWKETNDELDVTYVVAGIKNESNGFRVHSVCVVPFSQLEVIKKEFATLTSVHVYSVQKRTVTTQAEDVFGAIDCNLSMSIDLKRASAINSDAVAHMSNVSKTPETGNKLENVSQITDPQLSLKGPCIAPRKKMEPKGSLHSMFAKVAKENVTIPKSKKNEKKSSPISTSESPKNDIVLPDEKECDTPTVEDDESEMQAEDPIPPLKVQTIGSDFSQNRKRKLVEETALNDDGYLRTKKKWSECIESGNSDDNVSLTSGNDSKDGSKETTKLTENYNPNHGAVKIKQATLTSFFKRK